MKRFILFATFALLMGCNTQHDKDHGKSNKAPHGDHRHMVSNVTLMVQTEPETVSAGKPTKLKMMIHGADGKMVKDFAVIHEEKIHLIIVRDGLDQFAHIHPKIDANGDLTTTYSFPTGGTYRLYADHQPVGGSPSTPIAEVRVSGATPPLPALKPDVPGPVKGDGLDAHVSVNGAMTGGDATISFKISDPTGAAVKDLQPYLGAMGHLVVISQDGKQYVHAHPAEEKKSETGVVIFHAHFPNPGLYKGWGQFKRQGQVHVIPFVLLIEK
jgi:hypothetical protein